MCFLTCLGVTGLKENFFTVCFDSQLFQKVFKAEVGSPVIEESSFWMSSIFLILYHIIFTGGHRCRVQSLFKSVPLRGL